jgi:CheY-like chemotaxis protein
MSVGQRTMSGMRRRPPVVLLVDDSVDVRSVFTSLLQGEGFVVVQAGDGREAVDKARALAPDVIVMDLMLPVLDGFAAARVLKSYERTCHIPIVALTGHTQLADDATSFDEVIVKPCTPGTLSSRLHSVVARTREPEKRREGRGWR